MEQALSDLQNALPASGSESTEMDATSDFSQTTTGFSQQTNFTESSQINSYQNENHGAKLYPVHIEVCQGKYR